MTYYAVLSSYDDDGKVSATLVDAVESNVKPIDSYKSTKQKDIYIDWFDNEDEARKFVSDCNKESDINE